MNDQNTRTDRIKILLAKPGLDGHDVGVKVLGHALKNAGFQVVYTGLRRSVEEIVEMAMKENPDVIGMSILSGTHQVLCDRMQEVLKEKKINIHWIVGGNIPAEDVETLEKTGADKVFPTGTKIETVLDYIRQFEMKMLQIK